MAQAALDKKAEDVVVLDLRGLTVMTDFFVICSGGSVVQVKAITDHMRERVREGGGGSARREGTETARWILLDYGDVVAHVFHHAEREFYAIDRLWGDAPRVPIEIT